MNAVAAQMANLAAIMVQNQTPGQAGSAGLRRAAANAGPTDDTYGPTLKPGDVATFEPQPRSDTDSALQFIDCICDAMAQWKGFGPESDSWYAEDDLPNAHEAKADYESSNPIVCRGA